MVSLFSQSSDSNSTNNLGIGPPGTATASDACGAGFSYVAAAVLLLPPAAGYQWGPLWLVRYLLAAINSCDSRLRLFVTVTTLFPG